MNENRNRLPRTPRRTLSALASLVAVSVAPSLVLAQEVPSAAAARDSAQRWIEMATPYVLKAVGALVVLIVARIVAGWIGRMIRRGLESRKFDTTMTKFFAALARTMVLLAAVLGVLGMFGVETTSFAAVIGAAGLAIGLAFQGTLGNFAAGVLLLTFRPFKVGDLVTAAGHTGTVEEIELFTTTLVTPDNLKIIVPNSGVTGGNIVNMSALGTRRVDIPLSIAGDHDIEVVRKVLETVPAKVDKSLKEPAPQIFLVGFGAGAINWQVRVWGKPDDYWDVHQSIIVETKRALDAAKIEMPSPQMRVFMDKAS